MHPVSSPIMKNRLTPTRVRAVISWSRSIPERPATGAAFLARAHGGLNSPALLYNTRIFSDQGNSAARTVPASAPIRASSLSGEIHSHNLSRLVPCSNLAG